MMLLIFLFIISLSFAEENTEWKVAENIEVETIEESDSTKSAVSLATEELTKWVIRNGGFVNQLRLEVLPLGDGKMTDAQRGLFIKKYRSSSLLSIHITLFFQISILIL